MKRSILATVAVAASIPLLAACSGTSSGTSTDSGPSIVASTSAWGSIAQAIGGDAVSVTSIITDASQDPHSFEGSARVQLELKNAALVIENGGGYDDWMDTLLAGAGNPDAPVLDAAELSGYDEHPADGEFNEHVWYDFPTVQKVADRIASELSALVPADAATFAANAKAFDAKLVALEAREAALRANTNGAGAAITEPVPLYMLTASGFTNVTPAAFSEAIEEGTDVSPTVLEQTLQLFSSHTATVLVYNEQTSGPETDKVLAAATAAGVPVVAVTETMPQDVSGYLDWMSQNIAALERLYS